MKTVGDLKNSYIVCTNCLLFADAPLRCLFDEDKRHNWVRSEDWWRSEEKEMERRDAEKGMHVPTNKCWTCRKERR